MNPNNQLNPMILSYEIYRNFSFHNTYKINYQMLFILLLAIPTWANDLKRCYLDKYTLGDSESKR